MLKTEAEFQQKETEFVVFMAGKKVVTPEDLTLLDICHKSYLVTSVTVFLGYIKYVPVFVFILH